jgi:hypothetical protein
VKLKAIFSGFREVFRRRRRRHDGFAGAWAEPTAAAGEQSDAFRAAVYMGS